MRPLLSRLSLPPLPPWLLLLSRLMPLLFRLRLLPPLLRRKWEKAISSHHNRRTAIFPHFTSFLLYWTYRPRLDPFLCFRAYITPLMFHFSTRPFPYSSYVYGGQKFDEYLGSLTAWILCTTQGLMIGVYCTPRISFSFIL
ncbi:hypothetical protein BDV10DRAFT_10969 [Aspergillus recurvatus]